MNDTVRAFYDNVVALYDTVVSFYDIFMMDFYRILSLFNINIIS